MMDELRWHDLQWCLRRAPKQVLKLMKQHPGKLIAGGGFIRDCITNDKINDIDLFVTDKLHAAAFTTDLAKDNVGIHKTDNAYTITSARPTIQLIHRWTFESPDKLLASFDFTIAMAAFWWEGHPDPLPSRPSQMIDEMGTKLGYAEYVEPEKGHWASACHPDFYADLAARRLVYTAPVREEEPGGSMLRVLKFYQRGYRIPLDSLGAVMARMVMAVNTSKLPWDVAHPEQRWAKVLTGMLREVDPNVDPKHISHLPSKDDEPDVVD